MRLIDTHCHIDLDAFDDDRDAMLDRAREAGVQQMLVIGFEPVRWQAALELQSSVSNISVAAGLHPNSAYQFTDQLLDDIATVAKEKDIVAIGETGIDLYWNAAPLDVQQRAFAAQIDLARQLDLPFIIHQRDAEREVIEVLKRFSGPHWGVLHCFTGDWHYAKELLELGLHVGLGGAITFKSRTELHHAAQEIPIDRIVLETDSPFMAPVPNRGKRNEPAFVLNVAERLAELREISVGEVANQTSSNAERLFPGLIEQPEIS